MGLIQTSDPATEPVDLATARGWLKVDSTADDATISMLIRAARRMIERRTNRILISSGWELTLDRFPCPTADRRPFDTVGNAILVPRGPVMAVTAITYVDAAGAQQTLASPNYIVDLTGEPVRIVPAWNASWPITRSQIAAVKVAFTAGYADAAAVPDDLKIALQLLVAHWYENREAVVTGTISTTVGLAFDEIVAPYRLWTFV